MKSFYGFIKFIQEDVRKWLVRKLRKKQKILQDLQLLMWLFVVPLCLPLLVKGVVFKNRSSLVVLSIPIPLDPWGDHKTDSYCALFLSLHPGIRLLIPEK